jgi:hypothetical protein
MRLQYTRNAMDPQVATLRRRQFRLFLAGLLVVGIFVVYNRELPPAAKAALLTFTFGNALYRARLTERIDDARSARLRLRADFV